MADPTHDGCEHPDHHELPSEIVEAVRRLSSGEHDCEGVHVVGITASGEVRDLTGAYTNNRREARAFMVSTEAAVAVALEAWPLDATTEDDWEAFSSDTRLDPVFEQLAQQPGATLFVMARMVADRITAHLGGAKIDHGTTLELDDPFRVGEDAHARVMTWAMALASGSPEGQNLVFGNIGTLSTLCLLTGDSKRLTEHLVTALDFLKQDEAGRVRCTLRKPHLN